jgi:hypothetical protein
MVDDQPPDVPINLFLIFDQEQIKGLMLGVFSRKFFYYFGILYLHIFIFG